MTESSRDYEEERGLTDKRNLVSMQQMLLEQEGFVEKDEGHKKRLAEKMYNNTYLVAKIFVHLRFATKEGSFRYLSLSELERKKAVAGLELSIAKYNASLVNKPPREKEILRAIPIHLCNKSWAAKNLLSELLKVKGGKRSSANPRKRKVRCD
ncbi:hypothetical protein EDC96DRAFT_533868 [Choanephora cucurbitarum]|nr:hypothetical protein EDC96DRAFT_533868 [Choanephora cucurbitarum]